MTARKPRSNIDVQVEDPAWRRLGAGLPAQIRRAVRQALAHAEAAKGSASLTVLLTGDERVRQMNRQYRRKNKSTNVLSFPSPAPDYLGDIAIAYGVTAQEAEMAKLPLLHHVLHLTVHGALHLLGYDHESLKDAAIMEALEADILATMDISNPYLRRGRAA